MKIKKIPVKGLRNTRDVGQLSDLTNANIKKKTIIRSGRLDKMSEKNRNLFFKENDIRLVIDLRTDVEVEESKKIIFPDEVKYVHIPILNKAFFGITHEKSIAKGLIKDCTNRVEQVKSDMYLVEMYKNIVFNKESQKMIQEVLNLILDVKEGAVLYHCTNGKDRTGLITMFILYILGVDENIILDDYEATQYFNRSYIKSRTFLLKIFIFVKRDFRKLLMHMLKANRDYLKKTIDAIVEEYDSMENYVTNIIGFKEDKMDLLRNKLLDN